VFFFQKKLKMLLRNWFPVFVISPLVAGKMLQANFEAEKEHSDFKVAFEDILANPPTNKQQATNPSSTAGSPTNSPPMKPLQTLKDRIKQVWDVSLKFRHYKIEKVKAFAFYLNLLLQGVKALQKNYPSGPVAGTLLYVRREIEDAVRYTNALPSSLSIYQSMGRVNEFWAYFRSLLGTVRIVLQRSWVAIYKEINKYNLSPTLPSGKEMFLVQTAMTRFPPMQTVSYCVPSRFESTRCTA